MDGIHRRKQTMDALKGRNAVVSKLGIARIVFLPILEIVDLDKNNHNENN
jgi:hypothetical protein